MRSGADQTVTKQTFTSLNGEIKMRHFGQNRDKRSSARATIYCLMEKHKKAIRARILTKQSKMVMMTIKQVIMEKNQTENVHDGAWDDNDDNDVKWCEARNNQRVK